MIKAGQSRQTGSLPLANGLQLSLEKLKNKSNKIKICTLPALNLRPGLNSVANLTLIKNFQIFNWSSSWPSLITYKVNETGLDIGRQQ